MRETWEQLALDYTNATAANRLESIQSLWSGYGEIFRVNLTPVESGTLVVKQVVPPSLDQHPRGWNTDRSTQRKLKSYDVESNWYKDWSNQCTEDCRVPACITSAKQGNQHWILLEDLDASGYSLRHDRLNASQAKACLHWLASFHAKFLHTEPHGLWPEGTYWHLDTRPDEFEAMPEGDIKRHAAELDQKLSNCKFQTIVHGDAKVANFCFNADSTKVAAVDFQYAGGGCGMKDVAYFFGSCFDEHECEQLIPMLLDYYFEVLTAKVRNPIELEQEWRALFAPAWTDFYRFLMGWMPGHKKIHSYTQKLASETLATLT